MPVLSQNAGLPPQLEQLLHYVQLTNVTESHQSVKNTGRRNPKPLSMYLFRSSRPMLLLYQTATAAADLNSASWLFSGWTAALIAASGAVSFSSDGQGLA